MSQQPQQNSFLTPDHMEHLRMLLQKYFQTKRQVPIPEFWSSSQASELLRRSMMQVVTEVRNGQISNDLESMNKKTMSIMIPYVLQYIEQRASLQQKTGSLGGSTNIQQQPSPISATAPQRMQSQTVSQVMDNTVRDINQEDDERELSLHEQYGTLTPEETSVDKDRMFMVKLQELEIARNNIQVDKIPTSEQNLHSTSSASTSAPVAGTNTSASSSYYNSSGNVKSVFDVLLPQVQQASIPTTISTVFMPTPPRKGQEFLINSWQRNWVQYPQRNNYMWTIPIPSGIELSMTRVVGVFLSKELLRKSPYVVIQMEGAGSNTCQAILTPDKGTIHHDDPWVLYRPLTEDLGYLKSISIPWMVRLYTANGILLNIGRDGEEVHIIEHGVAEVSKECLQDIRIGDQVWIFSTSGEIFWCEVTEIQKDRLPYTFSYITEDSDVRHSNGKKGNLLNFSKQWSIVLDLYRSQQQK